MTDKYTADGKRKSSQTHARRARTCVCGMVCRGNGGWSSHKRSCPQWKAARAALAGKGAPTFDPAASKDHDLARNEDAP